MTTEADTCRKYVVPRLKDAGWDDNQINEQKTITNGEVILVGDRVIRKKQKRVDYLLKFVNDMPIAVVEAKSEYKNPGSGIQQAKEYALMLGLKFAYSTNGHGIIEHDFINGEEKELENFPSPLILWNRFLESEKIEPHVSEKLVTMLIHTSDKNIRYYQEIAINRTLQAILQEKKRILLTMATGTGKTTVAFQIIWKLWNSRWNMKWEYRKPRVLYLADRNILVDDPKVKTFSPFGEALKKIEGEIVMSRDIYFSTYQSLSSDSRRTGLFKQYPNNFFDLIIVDECHRGSARDESSWREILEYFFDCYQIGMTATPLRNDNIDTYRYFGNPLYTYSLKQGIEDGFLAPYKVYRIVTDVDLLGWRPSKGQLDKYGREIPDDLYVTTDFERTISMDSRTKAISLNISEFLKKTDRFAKTIVFCVNMEHAEQMRLALSNANNDLVQKYPDYVVRIVSEEGDIGRGYLDKFQEVDSKTPVIVTTSQLLTTGVDIPTCKNIVIAKIIRSMTDFKQIIGRGTRIRDDYGKYFFNILDYTGAATRQFADPDFDGQPALLTIEEMNNLGQTTQTKIMEDENKTNPLDDIVDVNERDRIKYYVDGNTVNISAELVYELDSEGKRVKVMGYTDYTKEKVRSMYTSAADLRSKWSDLEQRKSIMRSLEERGIYTEKIVEMTKLYDMDKFDILCYIAFNGPLRTRRERAELLKRRKKEFFEQFSPLARDILDQILEKYIRHGDDQIKLPDMFKVEPFDKYGNVIEISKSFGGIENLKTAIDKINYFLYAET